MLRQCRNRRHGRHVHHTHLAFDSFGTTCEHSCEHTNQCCFCCLRLQTEFCFSTESKSKKKARARQKLCAQLWSTQKDCNCLIQLIHMNNESFREMHGHIQNADYHVRPSGDSKSQHKCWIWKEMSTIQKLCAQQW